MIWRHINNAENLSKPLPELRASVIVSFPSSVSKDQAGWYGGTYRKNHNDVRLALHNHSEVKTDFKPFESFMNHYILDLRRRDESCRSFRQISPG